MGEKREKLEMVDDLQLITIRRRIKGLVSLSPLRSNTYFQTEVRLFSYSFNLLQVSDAGHRREEISILEMERGL